MKSTAVMRTLRYEPKTMDELSTRLKWLREQTLVELNHPRPTLAVAYDMEAKGISETLNLVQSENRMRAKKLRKILGMPMDEVFRDIPKELQLVIDELERTKGA